MHLHSHLRTAVRYDLKGSTYLCSPGRNDVTAAELAKLRTNSAFKKHAGNGHVVVHDEQPAAPLDDQPPGASETVPSVDHGAEPIDAPPPDEPPAVDPRARLSNESNKQYKARMAALDAAAPPPEESPAPFSFEEWDALDEPTREALWPTLPEETQRAVQERDAARQPTTDHPAMLPPEEQTP